MPDKMVSVHNYAASDHQISAMLENNLVILNHSSGYSLDTTGVLLVSSIIRVHFWVGKKVCRSTSLSKFLMIAVQLVLLP
ncbi:unnamed protein product [Rhizophagus irregularis]|nr:unnamed protein product [Rhizophagus irregularis]